MEAGALGSTTAFIHLNFNSALNLRVLVVPCITWGESTIFPQLQLFLNLLYTQIPTSISLFEVVFSCSFR